MDKPEQILQRINKFNSEMWNGYMFLIDLVHSTNRKIEYRTKWKSQTLAVFALFKDFLENIKNEINHSGGDKVILKSIGDACMAFIGIKHSTGKNNNKKCDVSDAYKIFKKFVSFREIVHGIEGLCEIRLKVVMTYLTEINYIDINEYYNDEENDKDNSKNDVMGRGIDFTFRLEKYAGKSHIVINKILYDNIKGRADKEWGFIKVVRNLKGWAKEQEFYIVTRDTWLEDLKSINVPPNAENVDLDLLKYYISKTNKQNVDEKSRIYNFEDLLNRGK